MYIQYTACDGTQDKLTGFCFCDNYSPLLDGETIIQLEEISNLNKYNLCLV